MRANWKENYGVKFDLAMSMEDQVLPLGLASIWAGCGAKYSWHGICNCATKIAGLNDPRQKEIYWYKGLDGQQVLMKWYSFTNGNMGIGGYAEARDPASAVQRLTAKLNTSAYNYDVAGAFGVGWDDAETLNDTVAKTAQDLSNSSTRVIVSNELDFFRDFEFNLWCHLAELNPDLWQ